MEHGTEFCSDSITVDDETLKKTIVRGISTAIADKQDVLNLILSNLAYAVTGEDDTLKMYATEKQLKTLRGIMDETMEPVTSSTGDGKRFQEEMKSLSSQMVVLREQLEIIKGRIDSNEKITAEIDSIKQCLSADSLDFTEYNDVTIRRIVEYIRVMKDNSIIIVLKGGMHLYEPTKKRYESNEYIADVAAALSENNSSYYTCHCTGQMACEKMKTCLGERLAYLSTGCEIDI